MQCVGSVEKNFASLWLNFAILLQNGIRMVYLVCLKGFEVEGILTLLFELEAVQDQDRWSVVGTCIKQEAPFAWLFATRTTWWGRYHWVAQWLKSNLVAKQWHPGISTSGRPTFGD